MRKMSKSIGISSLNFDLCIVRIENQLSPYSTRNRSERSPVYAAVCPITCGAFENPADRIIGKKGH
jgi:hypothetical protein